MEIIVAREQAEKEINEFLIENDVEIDTSSMNEADADNVNTQREKLIESMMAGRLTIADELIIKLKKPLGDIKQLKFRPFSAETMMCVTEHTNPAKGILAATGQLTGVSLKNILKLRKADTKVAMAVTALFLV